MPLICYNLRLVLVKPTLPLFGSLILILSATGTFNYKLAKWLDEKLKPLFVYEHTVSDIFVFADELREMKIKDREVWCCMMYRHCLITFQCMKPSRQSQRESLKTISSPLMDKDIILALLTTCSGTTYCR